MQPLRTLPGVFADAADQTRQRIRRDAGLGWDAFAWARLGQVRFAAGDLAGAEQALTCARAEWSSVYSEARRQSNRHVEAEICRLEAKLHARRRRHEEAVRALGQAVEIYRATSRRDEFRLECLLELAEVLVLDYNLDRRNRRSTPSRATRSARRR